MPVSKEHKKLALRTLGQVYRRADKVLVIEHHLLQVSTDWYERKLQLQSSEWVGRLWTLREGRLATDLYIQFKDRAIPVSGLLQRPLGDGENRIKKIFYDFDCTVVILCNPFSGMMKTGIIVALISSSHSLFEVSLNPPTSQYLSLHFWGWILTPLKAIPTMMDIYHIHEWDHLGTTRP